MKGPGSQFFPFPIFQGDEAMKKLTVVLIIIAVACASVFAGNLSIGVSQNYMHTNVIADFEGDHFGVEGAAGIPLVSGVVGLVNSISKGEDISFGDALGLLLLPDATVNGYWKAVDGKVFGLRLGIQGDLVTMINHEDKYFSTVGLLGLSLGLNFKFGERFSANLTGTLPFAIPLNWISEDIAKYSIFYYSSNPEKSGWDILMILPLAINQFARLSFKWSI